MTRHFDDSQISFVVERKGHPLQFVNQWFGRAIYEILMFSHTHRSASLPANPLPMLHAILLVGEYENVLMSDLRDLPVNPFTGCAIRYVLVLGTWDPLPGHHTPLFSNGRQYVGLV